MLAACGDELRADFQRYYGLNLDDMGKTYTVAHAAALARNLPAGSAVHRALNPALEWADSDYLLMQIEYDIRLLAWSLAGGKKSRSPKPKPIETPTERAKRARNSAPPSEEEMNAVADALGIPEDRR